MTDLVARSRSFTEDFSYDIGMVRGTMREMADRIETLEAKITRLQRDLGNQPRVRMWEPKDA